MSWIMVAGISVAWLVVGIIVALAFGVWARGLRRAHEDALRRGGWLDDD